MMAGGSREDSSKEVADAPAPSFWTYGPGRVLAWSEYGDPGGLPVFYYHGWPSSRLQAGLADRQARARGIRLISMDRPGMGLSTCEPGRSIRSWPRLMEDFADFLGIPAFGQLAVSGGGPYAFACAAAIPERLTGSVVLAGAVPLDSLEGGTRELHPVYRILIPFRYFPKPLFGALFKLGGMITRFPPTLPPLSWLLATLPQEDRTPLRDRDVWTAVTGSFRRGIATGSGRGVMTEADIYFEQHGYDPAEVRHPILYCHGGQDRNIPLSLVREFTGRIPSARLEVEPTLGHFSLVLRKVGPALDYLAEMGVESGG